MRFLSPLLRRPESTSMVALRCVFGRDRTTLDAGLSVIDFCQLGGQNGNRTLDVIPACAHRSCGDRVCEVGRIPNLRYFQNRIDAAVEAGYGALQRRDHVSKPHRRRSIVLDFPLPPHFVPDETFGKARANASWMIPAFGLCCLEIILVHHVLPRSGTFAVRISKPIPAIARSLPTVPGYPTHAKGKPF
jgi:hypothetical protein